MPGPMLYRLQLRDEDDNLLGEVKLPPEVWKKVRVNEKAADPSEHWAAGTSALRDLHQNTVDRQRT